MNRHKIRRRGVVQVWMAVLGIVLIGLVGLATDAALVLLTAHELQNAADAASLAAAQKVRLDPAAARQAALDIGAANTAVRDPVLLRANEANAPDGDVVFGQYDRQAGVFTATDAGYDAVRVVARKTDDSLNGSLPILFGRVFGVNTVNVSRSAVAMVTGETNAGLLVLCPDCECALEFSGTTEFVLTAADGFAGEVSINVNSGLPCSTCGSGSALLVEVDELNMVGDTCWNGSPTINAEINPNSLPVPDPLAQLEAPFWGADRGGITSSGTYQPGYYGDGLRITSSGDTVVLEPGIYVLDGEGLYVNGGNLIAHDVMFYVKGQGVVYLGGNGQVEISPAESGTYEGISIFQARDNTNEATVIGTSGMDLDGTYYFPNALLEIGGTGTGLGNQMIAWEMDIHGTGEFDIDYNGAFPDPGNRVFLVE